ncbi:amidohydrolase [Peribacillus deserti]|uniref:Amidohydrolase n=1 Tax=Peribacillus deserti TaxID=673318 RepID=A0A2N5M6H0_9BACI|nr:amidohydrolase [Peribacillus deserti]PLT29966.1 amidohydrolase [Peribacillus deserti]
MKTIFINGRFFTSNPYQPYADTMIVEKGKITWIGEGSCLETTEGNVMNLQGKRVLPGFVDAHMHAFMLAETLTQIACTPPEVNSIAEMLCKISQRRAEQKEYQWILGWGFDEGKVKEKRLPTRWELDRICPDVPVVITRSCAHVCIVNSLALELAGIDNNTPNPDGGTIDRNKDGELTGVLREDAAMSLVTALKPPASFEHNCKLMADLSVELSRYGITSVTEMMSSHGFYELFHAARQKGFRQKTVLYYLWDAIVKNPEMPAVYLDTDQPIFIGGVKLFADGSITGKTAWVSPSYLGSNEEFGLSITSREAMNDACSYASKMGLQVSVHAMGEQAIQLTASVFSEKNSWLKNGPSFRLEHASLSSQEVLKLASSSNIALLPQPIFFYAEIEGYLSNLGIERTRLSYPIKSMLEKKVPVCLSSDAPATAWAVPHNPFVGLKAAVTRKAYDGTDIGKEERINIEEAIILYTKSAAEICRLPSTGMLAPGYCADFIVLDRDILEVPEDEIDLLSVDETFIDGEMVYQHRKV